MFYLLSVIGLFFTNTTAIAAPPKVSLQVDVQNVVARKGGVLVALFKPGEEFPEGKPIEGKKVDASAATVRVTFSVEPGTYAIALFHDVNGNGKMDKNMLGIPKEPYGFSTNFRPKLSAPKFHDCEFSVGEGGETITIALN